MQLCSSFFSWNVSLWNVYRSSFFTHSFNLSGSATFWFTALSRFVTIVALFIVSPCPLGGWDQSWMVRIMHLIPLWIGLPVRGDFRKGKYGYGNYDIQRIKSSANWKLLHAFKISLVMISPVKEQEARIADREDGGDDTQASGVATDNVFKVLLFGQSDLQRCNVLRFACFSSTYPTKGILRGNFSSAAALAQVTSPKTINRFRKDIEWALIGDKDVWWTKFGRHAHYLFAPRHWGGINEKRSVGGHIP